MENKSIVTCHGDQSLFYRLHPVIVQNLPKERIEWKRSFGRPSRHIHIEANFVPFNPSIICDEEDWTLLGRPFFHTYWTECDIDSYKATIKDDISEWLATLKQKNCPDWLVVVVVNDDNKVKSKILRTSVYDKVKSDFCSKQTDRCIVLTEPFRQDNKSSEGWSALLLRIRQLLIQSYNRNLERFEDHMRNERERRTERGWNFFSYFMVQEELAFMLEMLGIYEDALVQYDELDALFTQFVLNHSAGDETGWITDLSQRRGASWDGLCLAQPIHLEKRKLIKNTEASLLDFRVYLFSRQCTLYFLLMRPWEVAQRAIPFMHNAIQELALLKIYLPTGAVSVWVYLSCMEVMRRCKKFTTTGHMEPYSLHTANLWDYARMRTRDLGRALCYLPYEGKRPAEVAVAKQLIAGIHLDHSHEEEQSEPLNNLKDALSSKQAFQKHYLELSELAMGTYKHIGRIRSARQIGRDLALFYMKLNEPQKAEGFLLDSLKTYKEEGWDYLAEETRLHIAKCQKRLDMMHKYAKTCVHIAAAGVLGTETRQHHQEEMLTATRQYKDKPLLFHLRPAFIVQKIGPLSKTFTLQKPCVVSITLESFLANPIQCSRMTIGVAYESPLLEHYNLEFQSRKQKISGVRPRTRTSSTSSTSSTAGINFYNHVTESFRLTPPRLEFNEQFEKTPNNKTLSSSGLVCKTPLKRLDSGPKGFVEKEVVREESDNCFKASDIVINPGVNTIQLQGQLEEKGRYLLGQLCISTSGIDFLKTFLPNYISFSVVSDEPALSLHHSQEDGPLVSGIPQEVKLILKTGSHTFPEGITVQLEASSGVRFEGAAINNDSVFLPAVEEYSERSVDFYVVGETGESGNEAVSHDIKAWSSSIDQTFTFPFTFGTPVQVTHKLYTAGIKKFLQVMISCTTDLLIDVLESEMSTESPDVQLASLNKRDQQLRVSQECQASFMWQVINNTDVISDLDLHFTFKYVIVDRNEVGSADNPSDFSYFITLQDYQTLYAVKSAVVLPSSDTMCVTGMSYPMNIFIKKVRGHSNEDQTHQLMYKVTSDHTCWAFSGKTSGVFAMSGDRYETCIEAMPLVGGAVQLPIVTLYTYIPPHSDTSLDTANTEIDDQPSEGATHSLVDHRTPQLEEFHTGQVYNCSQATRINVIPAPNASPVDITVVS